MAETSSHDARRLTLARLVLAGTALLVLGLMAVSIRSFLKDPSTGDYQHYYFAAKAVVEGQNLYQQHTRFYGYLPLWALLHTVLVPLGRGGSAAAFAVCNAGIVLVTLWLGAREVLRRLGVAGDPLVHAWVVAVSALVMSDKIRAELRLGQSDATILLCFVLGLMWLGRRPGLSGAALGFIANFKFQSMAMVPYLVVRRRWAALAWMAAASVGLALSGSLVWGWERNTEYLRIAFGSLLELMGATREIVDGPALYPLAWGRSVSAPSVLARVAEWRGMSVGVVAGAGMLTLAVGALAAGWGMYSCRGVSLLVGRSGRADEASPRAGVLVMLEWAGLIVAALVFSPQTTVRHLYLTLFVVIVAAGLLFTLPRRRDRVVMAVALGLFWLGMTLPLGGIWGLDEVWKWWGGPMWVSLGLYFTALWYGLGAARELPTAHGAGGHV